MSRYSAQILICFIAYIFLIFFIPLWVWLRTLQDCQYAQCPLPLSIVIRMRLVIRQSKHTACLAEVQLVHQNTLWHLSHSLVKMTDKMDEICINGTFSTQEPSEWTYFSIPVSNFTVLQPNMKKTTRLKSGWGFGHTNSPLSTARVLIDTVGLCLLRVSEVWRLFAPDHRR